MQYFPEAPTKDFMGFLEWQELDKNIIIQFSLCSFLFSDQSLTMARLIIGDLWDVFFPVKINMKET